MDIKPEILRIIKENESLINNEEFEELYNKILKSHNLVSNDLTYLFYKAGINPLDSMKFVPKDFLAFSEIKNFSIPKNIKEIKDYAFWSCKFLESIIIPNSVLYIGSNVFGMCSNLKNIKLPDSLQSIGRSTFLKCDNLSNINIPKNITHLPDLLFLSCLSLTNIDISNVETIGQSVFAGCDNLKHIELGTNLKLIDLWAIPDEVKNIYYAGTIKEWKKVEKKCTLDKVVHCKDGDTSFQNI